jgi:hypothetical protein
MKAIPTFYKKRRQPNKDPKIEKALQQFHHQQVCDKRKAAIPSDEEMGLLERLVNNQIPRNKDKYEDFVML